MLQHGQDAAVVVPVLGQSELRKDARHVTLDRRYGNDERFGDSLIGPTLSHKTEHLPLAVRQVIDRVMPAPTLDETADDFGIDHRAAGSDAMDGVDEALNVSHAMLQQVADTLGSVAEEVDGIAVLEEL